MTRLACLVFAGGWSRRLRPLTWFAQKAMLPIGNGDRLIDFALKCCEAVPNSIETILFVLAGRKSEQVKRYLRNRRGVMILVDKAPVGTGTSLIQHWGTIRASNPDVVLILAGDHFVQLRIARLLQRHRGMGSDTTLVCVRSDKMRHEYLELEDDYVHGLVSSNRRSSDLAFTGISMLSFAALDAQVQSLDEIPGKGVTPDILLQMLQRSPGRYFLMEEPWEDLGTWGRYLRFLLEKSRKG